jgi:hypothetical protein
MSEPDHPTDAKQVVEEIEREVVDTEAIEQEDRRQRGRGQDAPPTEDAEASEPPD